MAFYTCHGIENYARYPPRPARGLPIGRDDFFALYPFALKPLIDLIFFLLIEYTAKVQLRD